MKIVKGANAPKIPVFWAKDAKGNLTIRHYELKVALEMMGVANMELSNGNTCLVYTKNNRVRRITQDDVDRLIISYLEENGEMEVLEKYLKGITTYASSRKLSTLKRIPQLTPADDRGVIWFYFQNTAVAVTKTRIEPVPYEDLPHLIWEDEVLPRPFVMRVSRPGQFVKFLENVSGGDPKRNKALRTALGYMLSGYKDPSITRAIILQDEVYTPGVANGRTGKSLIAKALGEMRKSESIDGRHYRTSDPFAHASLELDTRIINFDDVGRKFTLEDIFSMLTSGITVNRKFKDAFYIPYERSPKVLVTSNYPIRGVEGNSGRDRSWFFELAPHYGLSHKPEHEFGNPFFSGWDDQEWNRFYGFMIYCAHEYLKYGLLAVSNKFLQQNQLAAETSPEFVDFMQRELVLGTRMDKRKLEDQFRAEYGFSKKQFSNKSFGMKLRAYARILGYQYDPASSGGGYFFTISDKNTENSGQDEPDQRDSLQSDEPDNR
ncbi:hypothetical protein [Robiginitalea sp. SC105]|uniref:hypothetical protein n=1 Tax=Robiginitalea sp. SC105 TaxID=2762332 RepID=UPI001639638F|nr:hypothetical protein [Robiginitalea sp. SC105]MBC2840107.1 hypothetical protein [Robiginitalea sp. SC105]